jgi:glyoxylase I family protein
MAITQVAHACIHAKDLEKSAAFYSEGLGMPVKFRFNNNGALFGIYFDAGNNTYIEVFQNDEELPSKSHIVHLCLEVDDIEATVADLRSKDIEVTDPKLGADQSWQAWITDPDGVSIELHDYTDNSSQNTGTDITLDG